MKLLIYGDDFQVCNALSKICLDRGFNQVTVCRHDGDVFLTFIKEKPTHVIVLEYDCIEGWETWQSLQRTLICSEKTLRCGYVAREYDDYIQLPFDQLEVMQKFGLNG